MQGMPRMPGAGALSECNIDAQIAWEMAETERDGNDGWDKWK
jgi:hypothetical protein